MGLSLDLHHGRPQQLALEAVAGPHDFGHNWPTLTLFVGDGLRLVGVERLVEGVDALQALLLDRSFRLLDSTVGFLDPRLFVRHQAPCSSTISASTTSSSLGAEVPAPPGAPPAAACSAADCS